MYMPFVAGALNFAWEVNALFLSGGLVGHVIWVALDVAILFFNLRRLKERGGSRKAWIYILVIIGYIAGLWLIFILPNMDGMLISVFSIDVIMAIEVVVRARSVSPHGKIPIAMMKLLGDLFAWLCYAKDTVFVMVTGFAVATESFLSILLFGEHLMAQEIKEGEKRKHCLKEFRRIHSSCYCWLAPCLLFSGWCGIKTGYA